MEIADIVQKQKDFFATGITLSYSFRKQAIEKIERSLHNHESDIIEALRLDLGKSPFESYLSEIGMVYDELHYVKKHLRKWMKKEKVKTTLANFRGRSWRIASPFGNVLIMSPWNYPILLTLDPLIAAIASGNTVVLKPGSYSKNVSLILEKIFKEIFSSEYVAVILGGRQENQTLLDQKFEYIFFTGSPSVGHLVQEKASVHLTPVTLELGGKSPTIVDETADIAISARRIVFGKLLNCGQTCVAPDYFLVQHSIKDRLVAAIIEEIRKQYGDDPLKNPAYGKIINEKHFERIFNLIDQKKVIFGGTANSSTNQICPTVLDNVTLEDAVMKEEIFGPIFPIITYDNDDELVGIINKNPTPLAFYIFTKRKSFANYLIEHVSFGGGCINDCIVHLASPYMPFGGVGNSGMGSYHGRWGFETFSHYKSIHQKFYHPDLNVRYQPGSDKKLSFLKKILK